MTITRIAPVERVRLLARMADLPRFTLLRAPAGFGKSTLLGQLRERLEAEGRQTIRFDLHDDLDDEALAEAMAAACEGTEQPLLLIDKAGRLAVRPATRRQIERMADLPGGPTIVLACRGDPGLALARHRANGDLLQIGAADLLFDAEEQQPFVDEWRQRRISPQRIDAMTSAIAGWPCGFRLQEACLQQGVSGRNGPVLDGSWRVVADYFEEEICAALPDGLRSFLTQASVMEQLSGQDCEELFGEGKQPLALALARGAPLWPIDPEHDRHAILPLFRQFLRAGLKRADIARIGARVCDLLEGQGRFREASEQALSIGDHPRAARLLELQLRADFALRDEMELQALAERIDPAACEQHPFILLALAQALTFRFEFARARRRLDLARALVEQTATSFTEAELRTLEMLLLHREMILALGQHEFSLAQELGDRLLRNMELIPPMQRVMILNSLTYAQQELYIFRGAERYYVQAKKLIPALDSWVSSVPLETFYARHLFQTGRTGAAIELLEQTLARLVEDLGPKPVLGAIAGTALAEMKFETNDLAEVEQLLADYGDEMEEFGLLPMTLSARIVQARLHMVKGEVDQGLAALERPFVGAGDLFDKMYRALTVERIYWLLRHNRDDAAKIACNSIGLSLTRPPEPHSSAATIEEATAMAWIQLARANRRIDDAIHVAQKWQRYTEGVGAVRSNVRWNVVLASLQTLAEEPSLAMRHLRRAVLLGAGAQYRSPFLAEADVLHELYATLIGGDLAEAERRFLSSIVDQTQPGATSFEQFEISVPLGTFSTREGAILRLVAKGLLNREIGATLGMTEGTVKWYLQRIYDKLGIRRRSQVAMLVAQWHAQALENGSSSMFSEH